MKSPIDLPPWSSQLDRALRLAANNNFVLPRDKFFTKREVKAIYGSSAHREFAYWFKSVRRFDQAKADTIRHRQSRGLYQAAPSSWPEGSLGYYTAEKYADWLINTKCFSWMSILKDEHMRDVWKMFADHGKPSH